MSLSTLFPCLLSLCLLSLPGFAGQDFTDSDLNKLLSLGKQKSHKGLIYVWSPHMPLSIRGVREVKALAHLKKIQLTVLLDPYSNLELAIKVASREAFPKPFLRRLESRILLAKDMTLHFPSAIPYRGGTLARSMRGGYDNPSGLTSYLDSEFEKLRSPASLDLPKIASTFTQLMGSLPALAQNKTPLQEVCRFAPFGVIQRTAPRRAASYFFRTFPNQPLVSYAGVDNPHSTASDNVHSYILNLKTRQEYRLPGPYDPVPICEDLMTVPNSSQVRFFDINKVLAGDKDPKPVGVLALGGVYQSVSACPAGGAGEVTMITDLRGATMQKLTVDTTVQPPTFKADEEPQLICENIKIKFPMLSKNGREISGADQDSKTTKIWQIEPNGTCTEVFDFHFLAGKADFSFDNRQLVFHVRSDVESLQYFQKPSQSQAMNIYLYDRDQKTLRKITNNYDRNSYYPVFRQDGTIVYMDMTREGGLSFVWVDPRKSPEIPFDVDLNVKSKEQAQFETSKNFQSLVAIGRTWYELCADLPGTMTVDSAALTALSLDEDECKEMIKKSWAKFKPVVLKKSPLDQSVMAGKVSLKTLESLSAEDLMQACPVEKNSLKEVEILGDISDTTVISAQNVIVTKCLGCHPGLGFNDPNTLVSNEALVKKMLWRISDKAPPAKRMPLDSGLSQPEREALQHYLEAYTDGKLTVTPEGQKFQEQSTRIRFKKHRDKDLPPVKFGP